MTRRPRDFYARDAIEREWMIENTWCDHCHAADLGLNDPTEFEDDGHLYIEGTCRRCGMRVQSEIVEKNSEG